jgi:hypothetical protein
VGISDAAIRKNNRLFLLRQEHERWVKKRAMVAHNNMEDDMGKTALGVCDVCGEKGQLRVITASRWIAVVHRCMRTCSID